MENLMNRFHVHLHVDDLQKSIAFYSKLFAAQPARIERDYAKWRFQVRSATLTSVDGS